MEQPIRCVICKATIPHKSGYYSFSYELEDGPLCADCVLRKLKPEHAQPDNKSNGENFTSLDDETFYI